MHITHSSHAAIMGGDSQWVRQSRKAGDKVCRLESFVDTGLSLDLQLPSRR
jgi:hypothetical protein